MEKKSLLRVSSIAQDQWQQLCRDSWRKCQGDLKTLSYKIKRAASLGDLIHEYSNGSYLIRYEYLNLLISYDGEIQTVWLDRTKENVSVSEQLKDAHKQIYWSSKFSKSEIEKLTNF